MPKPPKKDGLKAKLYAQKYLMYRMKFKDPSVSSLFLFISFDNNNSHSFLYSSSDIPLAC